MPSKTNTRKPAAPAGKPAKKKPGPYQPVILGGRTAEVFGTGQLDRMISALPVSRLKELLRCRKLPIPKDKETMVDRLVEWSVRDGATFVLSLH